MNDEALVIFRKRENVAFEKMVRRDKAVFQDGLYVRGALMYLPSGNLKVYGKQLKWFYGSWMEMQKYEAAEFVTDMVVVVEDKMDWGSLPMMKKLNCSKEFRRVHRDTVGRCVVVEGYTSMTRREEDFKHNGFVDSIDAVVFADSVGALKYYDDLLRTDMDTFLTPKFSSWRPSEMTVGSGGYCFGNKITCHRLYRIAKELNLAPPHRNDFIENIGSTWYGNANHIIQCATLSMAVMRYLAKYEFAKFEKQVSFFQLHATGWPEWHYGVLSMYAGQIAINHCIQPNGGGFVKNTEHLDFPSSSTESVHQHAHLHTWQNKQQFSKFVFYQTGYKHVNTTKLNLDVIQDYATYLAITSNAP